MSVAMLKSLAFTFCTPDGESGIAVQKPSGGVKSLGIGLETDSRPRIGLETWGDNNARGDIKVDNKVDNITRGDNKVDNKVDNNPEGDIKVDNKVDNNAEGDNKPDGDKEEPEKKSLNELPASCRQVLKALSEDGSFTQQALIRKLNLSRAAITKAIATLIKERYIIRRGARKNGYWEVLDR